MVVVQMNTPRHCAVLELHREEGVGKCACIVFP